MLRVVLAEFGRHRAEGVLVHLVESGVMRGAALRAPIAIIQHRLQAVRPQNVRCHSPSHGVRCEFQGLVLVEADLHQQGAEASMERLGCHLEELHLPSPLHCA